MDAGLRDAKCLLIDAVVAVNGRFPALGVSLIEPGGGSAAASVVTYENNESFRLLAVIFRVSLVSAVVASDRFISLWSLCNGDAQLFPHSLRLFVFIGGGRCYRLSSTMRSMSFSFFCRDSVFTSWVCTLHVSEQIVARIVSLALFRSPVSSSFRGGLILGVAHSYRV
jgi:hypothetical protein